MWINTQTKQTFELHSEIRESLQNMSLPPIITDDILFELNIIPYIEEPT